MASVYLQGFDDLPHGFLLAGDDDTRVREGAGALSEPAVAAGGSAATAVGGAGAVLFGRLT